MSGWKTATIKTEKKEELEEEIKKRDNKKREFTRMGKDGFRLYGYEADIHEETAEILNKLEIEKGQVLIIEANDTTDSGHGTLYNIEELEENLLHGLTQIDSKQGYEGACARDVTGYFREEHSITGYAGYI